MTNKFVFTHPKDQEGKDIKYMFMLSFRKKIAEIEVGLKRVLSTVDGIDNIGPGGHYTIEVSISRAFDADEVIAELTEKLNDVTGDVVVASPKQVYKLKLVK